MNKQRLKKPKRTIKNGQSRDKGNPGYKTQNDDKANTKEMSNTDFTIKWWLIQKIVNKK